MFSNFKKTFKKAEGYSIPSEIVAALSKNLPEGLEYKRLRHDLVVAVPESERKLKLELKLAIPEAMQIYNLNQIYDMLYRTQTEIKIDKNVPIKINGISIPITEVALAPLSANKMNEFYLTPKPFAPPLETELTGGDINLVLTLQRQPLAEFNKTLIKNIDDTGLQISLLIDEQKDTIEFTINFDLTKLHSVNEVLKVLQLYDAFIKGDGVLFATSLPALPLKEVEQESLNELLSYWRNISLLENKLGITFYLDLPLSTEEVNVLHEMHASFIREQAFREYLKDAKFMIEPDAVFKIDELIERQNSMVTFIQEQNLTLLGVKIDLFAVIGLCDIKVIEIIPNVSNPSKYECILDHMPGKRMFRAIRYFRTLAEAEGFVMSTTNFTDSKELQDLAI